MHEKTIGCGGGIRDFLRNFGAQKKRPSVVPHILDQLNPAQKEAVINFDKPSLIIAGAGSGKTRVLTSRIAYMIEQGVPPPAILALTFTNKAANEMRERIAEMVGAPSRYIVMGTFHSVFLRILRAEAERLGYPPAFTIYDTTDSCNLVKTIIREMLLDEETYKYKAIFGRISRLKNDLVLPSDYQADPALSGEDKKRQMPQFGEIYRRYMQRCQANGAMDFDDLLLNMSVLFRRFPETLVEYQNRFKYILVDEYQDTNYAQYVIVKALARHGNLCVVGDDAQSIYSFRGARIENIRNFMRDFPNASIFKLEQNYRSTQTIVEAANSVIEMNQCNRDLKKKCFSAGPCGENIRVIRAYTDREEAELVVGELRNRVRNAGARWNDVAILYRVNARSRVLEESLRRRDIPYKIFRGHSFFDRKEVKNFIAYVRLIVNPRDDEAFRRIINFPARGIGDVTIGKIASIAARQGKSMWEALGQLECNTPEEKTLAKKTTAFVDLIRSLSEARNQLNLYDFGVEVATRTGIIGAYKAENTPEAANALENIYEVLNSMELFRQQREEEMTAEESDPLPVVSVEEWLQNVALMTDMDNDDPGNDNKVTLMTIHSSKGLEFRYVFIVGLEDEQFPSQRSGTEEEIEEERRLFYVALTRAKESATLSFCESRFDRGSMQFCHPSRFLREINKKYLTGSPIDEDDDRFTPRFGMQNGFGSRNGFATRNVSARPAEPSRRYGPERTDHTPRTMWQARSGSAANFPPQPSSPQKVEPTRPDSRFRKIGGVPTSSRPESPASSPTGNAVNGQYHSGMRVSHPKFGPGTIDTIETSTTTDDLKITVVFDDRGVGRKTLLSKFARLTILG